MNRFCFAALASVLLCSTSVDAQQRAVQMRSIDFAAQTIELFNYGNTTESMSGWRFCTHDDDQVRVYSAAPGLGGMIDPGESLVIDVASILVAAPFDNDAYSMAIFDTTAGGFGGTANIVDHLQWSIGGISDAGAAFRSQQAVNGGVWTGAAEWIVTSPDTVRIELTDLTGAALHGPGNYDVIGSVVCDFNGDGNCDIDDLNQLLAEGPVSGDVANYGRFDMNNDARLNNEDVDEWLASAAAENGLSSPYKRGDGNLDGTVDGQDFLLWNNSKFAPTLSWDEGDFNGDGINDGQDFLTWNTNKFTTSDHAVPEPSIGLLACCSAILCVFRRRRQA